MDLDGPLASDHHSSLARTRRRVRRRLDISGSVRRSEGTILDNAQNKILGKEIMQSITCTPGLEGVSFEELRFGCYLQTYFTTGQPPAPVGVECVIPPAFLPFVQGATAMPSDCVIAPDIIMSSEPPLPTVPHTFTFQFYASDTFGPKTCHPVAVVYGSSNP